MRILATFILTFATLVFFGQTEVESLKQQADNLFKNERPLEALAIMEKLVTRKDTIEDYARFKTRIGLVYQSLDSIGKAREWFLSVMYDSLIVDNVEDFWLGDSEVRGNYKHVSCFQMAISYYKEGNFEESIEYYKQSLDVFPYCHFSGSDINKSRVKICNNIADLYSRKGDLTKAFSYLMPFFIDHRIYSERARKKAARIIKEHGLQAHYLSILSKDYTALIDNGTITLTLGGTKILLKDLNGKNISKNEIEEEAKYFWELINDSDIIEELKK